MYFKIMLFQSLFHQSKLCAAVFTWITIKINIDSLYIFHINSLFMRISQ